MKTLIRSVLVGLVMMVGLNVDEAVAQSPPDIKVGLSLTGSQSPDRLLYLMGDQIPIVLSFQNRGGEEITSKGFRTKPFHLFLIFTGPDGRGIISQKFEEGSTGDDAPPPPVIPVEVIQGTVELLQVEPVEKVSAGWELTVTLPNAQAYYALSNPGNYSVKAVIPMRTYLGIDQTIDSVDYSEIDQYKWKGALQSNTEYFTLAGDKDNDGYSYPEAMSPYNALPDCNDNDANEHPNQIWYKDSDNDGYSDGTMDTTSCIRPFGYKVASELIALTGDCDDNNPNRNPGKTEIPCNGVDDDCSPATPDVAAPLLASPANGATNVSTTPTLSWNAVSCATTYGLQVAKDSSFSAAAIVVNQSGITSASYTLATPLSNGTTYYWRVNAKNAGETSSWSLVWSFTAGGPTGNIVVKAVKYTIALGNHPLVTTSPIVGMPVRVFAKSPGSCAAKCGIISWPHYKEIWNNCPIVASGTTNASGQVTLSVPPGTYIVIGKYSEIYVADNVFGLKVGETKKAFLPFMVIATGKGLSCKYSQQTGSNLLIIEPEHVEWDGAQELYPLVFQSEGDWTVETSVAPPKGFVADYGSLSANVNTSLKSVQFTLTDVGGKWVDTQVKHRIKHKGKWKTLSTKIGVKLSEKLARQKGLTIFGEKIKK
jgi:hypothetical protein